MAPDTWPTKLRRVSSLFLDAKNPRLGRETTTRSQREIIQYLFEHDKAMDVAESIAIRGYFPNEPILAIAEDDRTVVIEGNRRLAALKALLEPGLLEGSKHRKIERLSRQIKDLSKIASVPVTIAPSRRATDQQIAGRHIGTSVLRWQPENQASFILDKLAEGYSNEEISNQLRFTQADIQSARLTRAIVDMARSLDLPEEFKAKLDNPRPRFYSTIKRVFDYPVGRTYLHVELDPAHGLRGTTTKTEFIRGFTKLVTDVLKDEDAYTSRKLNKPVDVKIYFDSWDPKELPQKKRGSFMPDDIIKSGSIAPLKPTQQPKPKKSRSISKTVLPSDFKVRFGNDRLRDIRKELIGLKRETCPNAGAVLLRVFFELAVVDYLKRTGEFKPFIQQIERQRNGRPLPYGIPPYKELVKKVEEIADGKLTRIDAAKVKKAVRYDASAPFSISELHQFVHTTDPPTARDIWQFWTRTEPLFRLMLEQDEGGL